MCFICCQWKLGFEILKNKQFIWAPTKMKFLEKLNKICLSLYAKIIKLWWKDSKIFKKWRKSPSYGLKHNVVKTIILAKNNTILIKIQEKYFIDIEIVILKFIWKRKRLVNRTSIVQSPNHVWLFATLWTAARQILLSLTMSWSSCPMMASVMPSGHFIITLKNIELENSIWL